MEDKYFEECRELIKESTALFVKADIYFELPPSKFAVAKVSDEWLKKFIIEREQPAFFMSIDSADKLQAFNKEFIEQLDQIRTAFTNYLESNSVELSAEMRERIVKFGIQFGRVKKALLASLNSLERKARTGNPDDIRNGIRDFCVTRLKDVFDVVVASLYAGMRQTPNNAVYEFILREVNKFLKWLGIFTPTVEIKHYVYVFNEEEHGKENSLLYEGLVENYGR